jgi:YqeY-like protein
VESYIPAAASGEEIYAAVNSAIAETGATGAKDIGKVMKAAMAKLAGKNVDGKRVNEMVRSRLTSFMTDLLIMLLSTDWFLPYWTEIGIDFAEDKRIRIQQGCREILEEILHGADSYFLAEFSERRKQATESRFIALLRRYEAEREVSAALKEWGNMSHRELTAVWECASLNRLIPSADGSGAVPYLELPIRAEVVKTWEAHALDPAVFENICLSSKTEWDIRTQKLLVSPKTLKNQLWIVLLDHRLRAFWADLRERLTPQQLQQLTSWYRAMIKITSKDDRPVVLPFYMEMSSVG